MKFFIMGITLFCIIALTACDTNNKKNQSPSIFSPRMLHQAISWRGKLWIVGGHTEEGNKNDVWSSADAIHWKLEIANAAFAPRTGHQLVVYNNKLWLIGGEVDRKLMNDVWCSSDGIHWSLKTSDPDFAPRTFHQVIAYHNELWLIGGKLGELSNQDGHLIGISNDVWSSKDGIHWVQRVANAPFLPRLGHQVTVFHHKLWLVGGFNENDFGEVWSSLDGNHWLRETASPGFGFRNFSALVNFNDHLWLIGGNTLDKSQGGDSVNLSDVWSSVDGMHWLLQTRHAAFPARWAFSAVNFHKQLLLLGGDTGTGGKGMPIQFQNDIWSSVDGVDWRLGLNGGLPLH